MKHNTCNAISGSAVPLPAFLSGKRFPLCLLFLLLLLAALGGCAPKSPTSSVSLDDQDTLSENEKDEVIIDLPYPPADDGLPLTREEAIAFSYTSDFIAPLNEKEQQEEVLLYFKYFIHRGRDKMKTSLTRAEKYLPYVFKVFNEKGIPEDIAYLAIVESGFNPNAVSRAGAAGMWQFMPATGRHFGLTNDWWKDERRDPFKATKAAAEYLSKLYEDFNDWYLALAAYNAGEGKISRALDGTGAEDFFDLVSKNHMLDEKAQLRAETQKYVPQLIAIVKIVRHLELLGFEPMDFSNAHNVVPLSVQGGTNMVGLAKATKMKWDEFRQINPAFLRQITPPGRSSTIYVPRHLAADAREFLQSPECRALTGWRQYKIRKGDTLSRIARRTGVPTRVLSEVNNLNPKRLRVGASILVPGGMNDAGESREERAPQSGKRRNRAAYTVASGDTLYSIARKYGVSMDTLRQANSLKPKATLRIGQVLHIPGVKPANSQMRLAENISSGKGKSSSSTARSKAKPAAVSRTRHTVRQGDTLWNIARRYDVKVADLQRWNKLSDKCVLKPGDTLTIVLQ